MVLTIWAIIFLLASSMHNQKALFLIDGLKSRQHFLRDHLIQKLTTFMGIDELWEILLFHKNAEVNSKMRLCADVLKSMFCLYQVSTWYDMIQNTKITKKWKLWNPEKRSPVAALPHFNGCCYCCCCCSLWSKIRTTGKHYIYHIKNTRANVRLYVRVYAHNQTTHKRLFVVFRK